MKDIDNIEDWYRDELNNYKVEPDKNGWNSLAEDLDTNTPLTDNNFSEWYKKETSKLEERPDFAVWDKLSTKLDTSSVWDKLAVSLDRYELLIWWKNIAIKGSAILLLLIGSYMTYKNLNNKIESVNNNVSTLDKTNHYGFASLLGANNIKKNTFHSYSSASKNTFNQKQSEIDFSNQKTNLIQAQITDLIELEKEKIENSNPKNREILYASNNKIEHYQSISAHNLSELKSTTKRNLNGNFNNISEKDILTPYKSSEFLVKKEKNKIRFNKRRFSSRSSYNVQTKRIYIGANIGIKKQGMISQIKENSALNTYNENALLDFGTNINGVFGLVISSKFNLETNISALSTSGYKRSYSTEGIAFKENLNLNYTSINILAKKMSSRSTFDNKIYSTNIFAGGYASLLRTASSNINGNTKPSNNYNNTDFGIVLGIEQDRYITKTLVITPGIRYNQGLANIANKNSAFESARNFSLEFNLGVKYIFSKSGR